jgi:hypothetical protein
MCRRLATLALLVGVACRGSSDAAQDSAATAHTQSVLDARRAEHVRWRLDTVASSTGGPPTFELSASSRLPGRTMAGEGHSAELTVRCGDVHPELILRVARGRLFPAPAAGVHTVRVSVDDGPPETAQWAEHSGDVPYLTPPEPLPLIGRMARATTLRIEYPTLSEGRTAREWSMAGFATLLPHVAHACG